MKFANLRGGGRNLARISIVVENGGEGCITPAPNPLFCR